MSMHSAGDIPLLVASENSSSERRITPSWTIAQLKARLEPVTGIPPLSQKLTLRFGSGRAVPIEAVDEEKTQLADFSLAAFAEMHVRRNLLTFLLEHIETLLARENYPRSISKILIECSIEVEGERLVLLVEPKIWVKGYLVADTRPPGMRPNYTDASLVAKYELPPAEYEKRVDSVLAWKKANKLGRFDPDAPSLEQAKLQAFSTEIRNRAIEIGKRCRVGGEDEKRGEIMYVGEVEQIQGGAGKWIGVRLDEPVGRNDGSLGGKRYWGKDGDPKHGVFVRPERVEVGEWPVRVDFEDMEEI